MFMKLTLMTSLVWAISGFAISVADNTGSNLTTVKLAPSASSVISTYYTYNLPGQTFSQDNLSGPGATTMSMILTNITGQNYSHMQVINNTQHPLAFVMTTAPVANPIQNLTNTVGRNLYVLSSGTASWDGLPIWNYLYVESANGQSVVSGDVEIMLWGSNNSRAK